MYAKRSRRARRAVAVAAVIGACVVASWDCKSLGDPVKPSDVTFRQLDASGDGILTLDEATFTTRGLLERLFAEAGKASGDRLTREEFVVTYERLRSKSQPAAKPSQPGDSPPAGIRFIDTS